jgi:(1->4)-alpha-D-glucan 1-alpha-D-glucosylmutase
VDAAYERNVQDFVTSILGNEAFVASFRRFHRHLAFHGFLNGLAQVVVKAMSPGVPDFYQGTETWDFSLVDPDNRRPVDYDRLARMRARARNPRRLLRGWKDGAVKLFVTSRSLSVRQRQPEVFRDGSYERVETGTPHAFAFVRGGRVLTVVPRLTAALVRPPHLPLGDVWGDLALGVAGRWTNAFTGESVSGERLLLRDVFATFPVAILERS